MPDDRSNRPNLLLVCVDCLREDHLSGPAADTPFLDGLRHRGLVAQNLYATATTTSPCVASLLTGTYSERNGVQSLDTGELSSEVDSLAERFGAADYRTEALVTGPLVEETDLQRGFDAYRYREPDQSLFRNGWIDTARDRLNSLSEPFAAYVHLWELHEDIHVPPRFDTPEYGETRYARAVSALDRKLETLLDTVPEDTIVVIHGDHGESITNRGSPLRLGMKLLRDGLRYYGGVDTRRFVRRLNQRWVDRGADVDDHYLENGHGENVFDFVANVPLVVTGTGIDSATIDAQTRQIDVLPTLLDACGIDYNPTSMEGVSLLEPGEIQDRPAYMRACGASLHGRSNWARAVRAEGAKYVEYPGRDWDPELYDLENDPLELDPIDEPGLAEQLRGEFPSTELEEGEKLDVEDRLEALGYR